MPFEAAAEAKCLAARTLYCRDDIIAWNVLSSTLRCAARAMGGGGAYVALDSVLAIWCWAPTQVGRVVNICPVQHGAVSLKDVVIDDEPHSLFVDNQVALFLHALDAARLPFKLDLLLKIGPVAVDAEAMSTCEGHRLYSMLA